MLNFCRKTDSKPAPARRNGELESLRKEERRRAVVAETDRDAVRRLRGKLDSMPVHQSTSLVLDDVDRQSS